MTKAVGAQAIHPGYGFLAESADFAQACEDAGITFVGPTPEAIRLLGDKARARQVMQAAGIPVIPGTSRVGSPEAAAAFAAEAGYPIVVKATGGGGGRGIRVVTGPEELESALQVAGSEALQAFGDASLYVEKFLQPVRHVEVQVMADHHGRVVSLGERECSIQRRHQKIVEEAPSPAVAPALRSRLVEAAVAVASAADYRGAGTVEFLLDQDGRFYFLEVNTRLQVEHPVTELLTGLDLVRDQLLVAAGHALPYRQEDIQSRGWAIECRIAAEDPCNDFLPSLGRVRVLYEPSGPGIRVDSSLYDGLELSPYYDSLLAKVISWGKDREEARLRMRRALGEYVIAGVKTNLPFHLHVMEDPDFQRGNLSTGYVDGVLESLREESLRRTRLAALGAALLAERAKRAAPITAAPKPAPRSPWATTFRSRPGPDDAWRRSGGWG